MVSLNFFKKNALFSEKSFVAFIYTGETVVDNDSPNTPPPFSPGGGPQTSELTQQLSPSTDSTSVQQLHQHLTGQTQPQINAATAPVVLESPPNMDIDVSMGLPTMLQSPVHQNPTQNSNFDVHTSPQNGNNGTYYGNKEQQQQLINVRQMAATTMAKDTNQNFVEQNGVNDMYNARNGHATFRSETIPMNGNNNIYGNGGNSDPMMNGTVLNSPTQQQQQQTYRKFVRTFHDQMIHNGDAFKLELKDEPENGF